MFLYKIKAQSWSCCEGAQNTEKHMRVGQMNCDVYDLVYDNLDNDTLWNYIRGLTCLSRWTEKVQPECMIHDLGPEMLMSKSKYIMSPFHF